MKASTRNMLQNNARILICFCSHQQMKNTLKVFLKTVANHLHNHFNDKYAIITLSFHWRRMAVCVCVCTLRVCGVFVFAGAPERINEVVWLRAKRFQTFSP